MSLPVISREMTRQAYILAIDTVGFSDESDSMQYEIFRDLLADFSTDKTLAGVRQEDFIALMTGDGLILVFGGDDNRLVPLWLCQSILEKYAATRRKELRCGINCGPAYWLEMSNGSRQVIGHAINWAVRVMTAAGRNEVFLSNTYYDAVARPARSEIRGVDFEIVGGKKTKKGEDLPVWRARVLPQ